MRLKRVLVALVTLLAVTAVTAGVVTGWFALLGARGLYATGLWRSGGASTISPGALQGSGDPSANPGSGSASSGDPSPSPTWNPVLAAADDPGTARAERVGERVRDVPSTDVGSTFGGIVVDGETGRALYRHRSTTGWIPASTAKLLTSTTALQVLGPDHRFSTRVLLQGRTAYLVGGGDPYLMRAPQTGRASVTGLARDTASALRSLGIDDVRVRYDRSLFTGPSWNPRWPSGYRSEVGEITALTVDGGRVRLGQRQRSADPSRAAADAFVSALRRAGVTVRGKPAAERAPTAAQPLAEAMSMPLAQIVETLLMVSDNDATEIVLRQAAAATGQPASFAGGVVAVRRTLTELGAWRTGAVLYDGSGLARQNRVPATTMAAVVRLAIADDRPELRAVALGLPVAGVEGSLRIRFADDRSAYGRGVVRGKTGTLSKVHSLAGYVWTRDGDLLVFAFLVNDPDNDYASVVWLDRVTTALSRCGC